MERLSEEAFQAYARAWKERIKQDRERLKERAREARETAVQAAKTLVQEHGATEVWLFGSLAKACRSPYAFGERSDVDLGVRGVPPEEYFHVLAAVNEESPFNIDLIDMDGCPSWLLETILRDGELLARR